MNQPVVTFNHVILLTWCDSEIRSFAKLYKVGKGVNEDFLGEEQNKLGKNFPSVCTI